MDMRIAGKSHVGYGKSSVLSPKSLKKTRKRTLKATIAMMKRRKDCCIALRRS